jgi:3-dehydroquinate synthase
MRIVPVSLGSRSYQIKVGGGLLARLGADCAALKLGQRCAVLTDSNVGKKFAKAALKSLAKSGFAPVLITVPAGEKSKCLSVVEKCHDQLAKHRLERKSFIVALGGG